MYSPQIQRDVPPKSGGQTEKEARARQYFRWRESYEGIEDIPACFSPSVGTYLLASHQEWAELVEVT
jgi:hypothetical protein